MYCTQCGTQKPPNATYCPECGVQSAQAQQWQERLYPPQPHPYKQIGGMLRFLHVLMILGIVFLPFTLISQIGMLFWAPAELGATVLLNISSMITGVLGIVTTALLLKRNPVFLRLWEFSCLFSITSLVVYSVYAFLTMETWLAVFYIVRDSLCHWRHCAVDTVLPALRSCANLHGYGCIHQAKHFLQAGHPANPGRTRRRSTST
ncbi:MAG: zinc ribbon domain-containing protein [Oscillospiraceae bacterium]|nr:zinc ribbon domain-containing protein [Oscillospiraceae bacterium]